MASFCEWTAENAPEDPEAAKLMKAVGNGPEANQDQAVFSSIKLDARAIGRSSSEPGCKRGTMGVCLLVLLSGQRVLNVLSRISAAQPIDHPAGGFPNLFCHRRALADR